MPALVAFLINALRALVLARIATWALKVLGVLGLSFATQQYVVGPAIESFKSYVNSDFGGGDIGSYLAAFLGLIRFDQGCSIIIGAITFKATADTVKAILVKS
jgi:hypothetical protein